MVSTVTFKEMIPVTTKDKSLQQLRYCLTHLNIYPLPWWRCNSFYRNFGTKKNIGMLRRIRTTSKSGKWWWTVWKRKKNQRQQYTNISETKTDNATMICLRTISRKPNGFSMCSQLDNKKEVIRSIQIESNNWNQQHKQLWGSIHQYKR